MEKLIQWVHTRAGAVTLVQTWHNVFRQTVRMVKNFVPYLLIE